MVSTSQSDEARAGGRSLLPRSRVVQVGVVVAAVCLVLGAFVMTGPTAAMMGIWGATVLLLTVGGYIFYRVWYSVGS